MTTTVTRADREMAAKMWQGGVYVPLDAADKSDLLISEWIRSGLGLLKMHEGLPQLAQAFANHRAASTQVLREAAERLCESGADECDWHCIEGRFEVFGIDGEDERDTGGDGTECVLVPKAAYDALRSALAAETSGRDGGGNG